MSTPFPHLFSPLRIGNVTIKNRIMNTGHAAHFQTGEGLPTDRYADYVGERAKGGAGIIVTGHTIPVPDGEISLSLSNASDRVIPAYKKMAAATHKYDVPLLAQMGHRGRRVSDSAAFLGRTIIAPSPVPAPDFSAPMFVPHELTTMEVERLVEAFGLGARRVVQGELDGVEISVGMDYLFTNFLHSHCNRRSDKYGGATLSERMTFLREVLRAIRSELGSQRILGVRMYDDQAEYSMQLEDHVELSRLLDQEGLVDYLNIWQGMVPSPRSARDHWPSYYYDTAAFVHLPSAIKEVVSLPVVGTGRMDSPAAAENALAQGKADIIGMARTLIADPHFPNKAKSGQVEDIRSCIACTQSCVGHIYMGLPVGCIYNPVTGREAEWGTTQAASEAKHVVIVGAGPAGMETARVAAARGHKVTLLERSGRMGGQINLITKTPKRGNFEEIILWFERQLPKLGVDIRLRIDASPDYVLSLNPDEIVVATGSVPFMPEVEGIEGNNVASARDVLAEKVSVGSRVLVVDTVGRAEAITTADYLADRGHQVELITGMGSVAQDMPPPPRHHLIEKLKTGGVKITTSKGIWSIAETEVDVYDTVSWEPSTITADTVVFGSGGKAEDSLYHQLVTRHPKVHLIGDAYQARDIEVATTDGHRIAREI